MKKMLALLILAFFPTLAQAQSHPLTKDQIQQLSFILGGSWDVRGSLSIPSGTTLPATCTSPLSSLSTRAFWRTTDLTLWGLTVCNAGAPTWVQGGGAFNPSNNINFSGNVAFTGTTDIKRQQTIEVCKSGCGFSTVTAALASITDASTTKRYTIDLHPGDYDENITAVSYVTIRGRAAASTRIRGASATTVTLPAGTTEVALQNLTIGGVTAIGSSGADTSRTIVRISNCLLGIIDGTESASGKTTSCLLDTGKTHDYDFLDTSCRSIKDGYRIGQDSSIFGTGTKMDLDSKGLNNALRGWSWSDTGAQITESGAKFTGFKDTTTSPTIAGVEYNTTTNNGTRPTRISFVGSSFILNSGVSTASGSLSCLSMATVLGAQQANSVVNWISNDCDMTDSFNNWSLTGTKAIGVDADWANVSLRIVGGRFRRSGGGGTNTDIQRASTLTNMSIVGVDYAAGVTLSQTILGNWTASGTWSFTGGATMPLQLKTVCPSGCDFTSVASAMAAITDSAPNKRYTVLVSAGSFTEFSVTAKSYVSLIGAGRDQTILPNTHISFSTGSRTEGFEIAYMTIGGNVTVFQDFHDDLAWPTTTYIHDFGCGLATGVSGQTTAPFNCIYDRSTGGHNFVIQNSKVNTSLEAWDVRANCTYFDLNNTIVFAGGSGGDVSDVYSAAQGTGAPEAGWTNGGFIFSKGLRVTASLTANLNFWRILDVQGSLGTVTGPLTVLMEDAEITVAASESNAFTISGIYLGDVGANTGPNRIDFRNVNFTVTDANGTHPIKAINVGTTDADHATYGLRWHGGKISMSGGLTMADVANSDNTAGLIVELDNVTHSGTYSGTVAPTIHDASALVVSKYFKGPTVPAAAPTVSGEISYDTTANDLEYGDNGTNRKVANLDEAQTFTNKTLTAPLITMSDLVVATCSLGQIGIDNGGATKEWCVCGTANVWGCWKLTDGTFNANGPAD